MSQMVVASPSGSYLLNISNIKTMPTEELLGGMRSDNLNFVNGLIYAEEKRIPNQSFYRFAIQRDHIDPIRIVYRKTNSVFRARNAVYGFTVSYNERRKQYYIENLSFLVSRMPILHPGVPVRPMPLPNIHASGQVCIGSVKKDYLNCSLGQCVDQFLMHYWNGMFDGDLTVAILKNGKSTKKYIDSLYRIGRSERAFVNGDIDRYLWKHSIEKHERSFGDHMNKFHGTNIEV